MLARPAMNATERDAHTIPASRFVVDGFRLLRRPGSVHVLTHFHADHYGGLDDRWGEREGEGDIWCTPVTAKLVKLRLGVRVDLIRPLPLGDVAAPEGAGGWTLQFVDANHCPGAAQALFTQPEAEAAAEGRAGKPRRYVHCGDMRACEAMHTDAALRAFVGCDAVFLDTTYAAPKHTFPPQGESIEYCAHVVEEALRRPPEERPLVLVCAYSIGKERILLEIARRCGVRIGVDRRRMATLRKIDLSKEELGHFVEEDWGRRDGGDEEDEEKDELSPSALTTATGDAPVRIVSMNTLGRNFPYFQPDWSSCDMAAQAVGARGVLGILPTGWNYNKKKGAFNVVENGNHAIHLVSYSEHSSFDELRSYVRFMRPAALMPTVFSDNRDRSRIIGRFSDLVDSTGSKKAFLGALSKRAAAAAARVDSKVVVAESEEEKDDVGAPEAEQPEALRIRGEQPTPTPSPPAAEPMESMEAVTLSQKQREQRDCEQLCAVCGVSATRAAAMLRQAGGSVEQAANWHFLQREQQSQSLSQRATASPGSKRSSPAGRGKNKRQRGSAGGGAAGKGQASIASFFTSRPKAAGTQAPPVVAAGAALSLPPSPAQPGPPPATAAPPSALPPSAQVSTPTPTAVIGRQPSGAVATAVAAADFDTVALPCWRYSPATHAPWCRGEAAPFAHVAATFAAVGGTTGRNKKIDTLANCWRALMWLCPADVLPCVFMAINRIASAHEDIELGVGGSSVSAAVAEVTGAPKQKLSEAYKRLGDLGDVAAEFRCKQRLLVAPRPHTARGVYQELLAIAAEAGQGSTGRKHGRLLRLLRSTRGAEELRYLVRILLTHIRIGATEALVLTSLAKASVLHRAGIGLPASAGEESGQGGASTATAGEAAMKMVVSQAQTEISLAYKVRPDIAMLVGALLEGGIEKVAEVGTLTPGAPVKPMLAKVANGAEAVHEKLSTLEGGAFVADFKYDGMRAQIHLTADGSAKVFSRGCEDSTEAFPDAVAAVREALAEPGAAIVIDAELVAVDRSAEGGRRILPFQTLSTRARTAEGASKAEAAQVDVCVIAFDLLFCSGRPMVQRPLSERLAALREALPKERPGVFEYATQRIFKSADLPAGCAGTSSGGTEAEAGGADSQNDDLHALILESVEAGCEGLMCKALSSVYEPGRRADAWLKVKRDYVPGLADSLDLVPIGAWYGNGRKAGWFSPWLMAAVDTDTGELHCLCRVMSGFSDEFYKRKTAEYKERMLDSCPAHVHTGEQCSVWFSPFEVWEIRGADLTASPVHAAGAGCIGEGERGVGLRFPRFVRERPDKAVEEGSSVATIVDMFLQQAQRVHRN